MSVRSRRGAKTQRGEDLKWGSVKASTPSRRRWWWQKKNRKLSALEMLIMYPVLMLIIGGIDIFLASTRGNPAGFGDGGKSALMLIFPWMMFFLTNTMADERIKKRIVAVNNLADEEALRAVIAKDDEFDEVQQAAAERLEKLKLLDRLEALEKGSVR